MSKDDQTPDLPNDDQDGKETQPTITAVFRLLREVESRINARFDETEARFNARMDETEARFNARMDETEVRLNARLDEIESRLARDIEAVNTRVTDGFKELTHKINALNRRALQSEADYQDLNERIGRLESNAS